MTSLKNELAQLKDVIAMAVTQIKDAIATLCEAKCATSPQATTIADDQMDSATDAEHLTSSNLQSFIFDLKHELATFFIETHAIVMILFISATMAKNSFIDDWPMQDA